VTIQAQILDLMLQLKQDYQTAIMMITHDLGVIADDVTHVLSVNQKLLFSGTAKEILSCEAVSEIYGTKAHVVHHHCGGHTC